MTREENYKTILKMKSGTRDALIELVGGEDAFNDLCRIGLIRQGIDARWVRRWKCTPLGESILSTYVDLYEQHRRLDAL